MATWAETARDSRSAAKELLDGERFRSSCNRSYYAAYHALASVLEGQVNFGYAGNNPTHEQLEPLILNNLYDLSRNERHELRKAVRALRRVRIQADYVPLEHIDKTTALNAYRDLTTVFKILGVDT